MIKTMHKWMILPLIMILCAWSTPTTAQANFQQFLKKYEKQDDAVVINFGKEMIKMLKGNGESDNSDMDKAIKGLEALKILSFENRDAATLFDEALGSLKASSYKSILSMNSQNSKVKFYAKSVKDEIAEDLVMVVADKKEFSVINLMGTIPLDSIRSLSKTLGIDEDE